MNFMGLTRGVKREYPGQPKAAKPAPKFEVKKLPVFSAPAETASAPRFTHAPPNWVRPNPNKPPPQFDRTTRVWGALGRLAPGYVQGALQINEQAKPKPVDVAASGTGGSSYKTSVPVGPRTQVPTTLRDKQEDLKTNMSQEWLLVIKQIGIISKVFRALDK